MHIRNTHVHKFTQGYKKPAEIYELLHFTIAVAK